MPDTRYGQINTPRTARNTISIAAIAGISAIGWAHFTMLPEMAFAKGSLQPTGSLRRIEHLDGGVVETIYVAEGESVTESDEILRLSDVDVETEIESFRVRERVLTQAVERNRLLLGAIGFNGWVEVNIVRLNQRGDAQARSYEASRLRLTSAVTAIEARIEMLQENIANLTEKQSLETVELKRTKDLHTLNLIGDKILYESKIKANSAKAELLLAHTNLVRARSDLEDARAAVDEYYARFRDKLLADIEAAMEELDMIQRAIVANRLRRDRITVHTPVSGIVQALYLSSRGEVVEPGGLIAEVLPTTETLIAEIQTRPRDIGHISIGDPVDISLTTFNAKQYGALKGWVQQISATSTQNERFETYYLVRVKLERQSIGEGVELHDLKAGMEVDASIRTGDRSILNYVMSPILGPIDRAFRER